MTSTNDSRTLLRLLSLVLTLLLPVTTTWAAPAAGPSTVDSALEAGDLSTARELAVEQRKAEPDDPGAWKAEAEVHEAAGDFAAAIEARRGQLAALPDDAAQERAEVEQRIVQLGELSRGTVVDEPPSTHREELDAKRSPPPPKVAKAPAAPPPEPKRDRIVRKWYFWVTMAAIVASAAAITGIAIKAATREQSDDLDAQAAGIGGHSPSGATIIRF